MDCLLLDNGLSLQYHHACAPCKSTACRCFPHFIAHYMPTSCHCCQVHTMSHHRITTSIVHHRTSLPCYCILPPCHHILPAHTKTQIPIETKHTSVIVTVVWHDFCSTLFFISLSPTLHITFIDSILLLILSIHVILILSIHVTLILSIHVTLILSIHVTLILSIHVTLILSYPYIFTFILTHSLFSFQMCWLLL